MEPLNILYVGDSQNSTIWPALDADTMTPQTTQEALAMYALYFPEIIILEGHSDMVREVFYHLASGVTEASLLPAEAMLVIDDGGRWNTPPNTLLTQLPASATTAEVLRAIEALVAERESMVAAAYHTELQADLELIAC